MSNLLELGFGHTEQEYTAVDLAVAGDLPEWLEGTLVRNGPGTFHVGDQSYRHWFDGLAMLHKFSFGGDRVSYANKYLETKAYREARKTGKIAYSEFATDPCRSLFSRVMSVFSPEISDSAKVSITRVAEKYLALAETPIQVEFDLETLNTVGVFNYEERLAGQMTTVHPHFDDDRHTMYNMVTRYNALSHYRLYQVRDGGAPQRVGQIPVRQPSYMHSFGMSQNYVILTEFPLVVNPIHLLLWMRPYIENFRWKPERGTPFWIMDRRSGEVVGRFDADPFFAFHHVNAFERGNEIVVDIAAYPDAGIINAFYLKRLEDNGNELPCGQLRRYRIPLQGGPAGNSVSYETISEACMELPHFDYDRYNMNGAYRYVYAVGVNPAQRQGFYNQLVKVDIAGGTTRFWHEPDAYPGEPIFVGSPGRSAEDDGVILSVVLDARAGTSYLLVLDARQFDERARITIPHPVLFGYHGAYLADG